MLAKTAADILYREYRIAHDEVLDVLVYGSSGAFKVKVKSTNLQTRHSLERQYIEMKSKVASGKTQWFKGQISNYDGLTGKYGIYFPCDGEVCTCIQMTRT